MKKILTIILIVLLVLGTVVTAYAEDEMEASSAQAGSGAKYTYITSAHTSLSINSSGKATVSNVMEARTSVDKVVISTYLQKYSNGAWSTVKHWTDTKDACYLSTNHSRYVMSGYNYRALTYFYAYDGPQTESTSLVDYESY